MEALGVSFENYNTQECPSFINETNFWLDAVQNGDETYEWAVLGNSRTLTGYCVWTEDLGLRPVIVVLKSDIQ